MAKAQTKTESLTKQEESMSLERPDWLAPDDVRGTEGITSAEMVMPRFALAQSLSPQLTDGESSYIEGLKAGHYFNTVTNEVYGNGPLRFAIIKAERPRAVEFIPRAEGGGMKDPNVPLNDERCQWGENGEQPVATIFHDMLCMLLPNNNFDATEMIGFSFKGTAIKAAKMLKGFAKLKKAPIFAGAYKISSVLVKGKKGPYYVPVIAQDGWIPTEMKDTLERLFTEFSEKEVVIDQVGAQEEVANDGGDRVPGEDDDM